MRIGRYVVERVLGAGGQGTVYAAVHEGPGGFRRRVALKVMADGTGLRREARLGGLLRHPHLVDVFEVGEHEGSWFLAMEYCGGGSLAARTPLPRRAVVDVGLQVCAALEYAHAELGLVHLDLKPQNLLLDGPTVKVADLGIARVRGRAAARIEGTPGYMAPELLRGAPVDARADVYALGVVLHELASGHRNWRATLAAPDPGHGSETFGGLDLATPPPAPDRDADPRARWLAPVLEGCLAQHADDRFPSMAALARALRAVEADGASLVVFLDLPPSPRPSVASGTNLPLDDDPIVGRVAELGLLDAFLADSRLIAIRGPVGVGKSRLAREAARRHHAQRRAQAWICDLSDVRSAPDLTTAVARTIGLQLAGADDEDARVGLALSGRGEVLLVLDDLEPFPGAAEIVARWCEQAPLVRVLVTSRTPFRAVGERVVDLDVLPEGAAVTLVETVAARRGVDVRGDPLVPELVRRLASLPLALELAAGRLGVLPLAEVLENLSLSLLRSGRAGVHSRQATLRDALSWSCDLLDEAARSALAQLSVFRGGFTLEAAEEVLALPPDAPRVVDVVATLVERSLVTARGGRLLLLEPVREFAAEQLGDVESVERRYVSHFASFGTDAALARLGLHGGVARLRALVPESANLIGACRVAIARDDAAHAVAAFRAAAEVLVLTGPTRLAAQLADELHALGLSEPEVVRSGYAAGTALRLHGRPEEARERFEVALAGARAAGDLAAEGHLCGGLGLLHLEQGRRTEAEGSFERSLDLLRQVGDRAREGVVLGNFGMLHMEAGRADATRAAFEQALAVHRDVGNRRAEASVLGNLGILDLEHGRLDEARDRLERGIAILRDIGFRSFEGVLLGNVGLVYAALARLEDARTAFLEALAIHREVGNRRFLGSVHGNLAEVHLELGEVAAARAQLEVALAIHREVGNRRFEGITLGRLATAELSDGAPAAALAHLEAALELQLAGGQHRYVATARIGLARAHRLLGRPAVARDLAAEGLSGSRALGDRLVEAEALAELAELDAGDGRGEDARRRCAEVVRVLRTVQAPGQLCAALCALARAERRADREEAARAALDEAMAIGATLGRPPSAPVMTDLERTRRDVTGT